MKNFFLLPKMIALQLLLAAALLGASSIAGADNTVAYEVELEAPSLAMPQSNQTARSPEDVSQATPQPARQLALKRRHSVPGAVQRQRNPELSDEQLLIVAYDSQGKELYRTAVHDPRVIRAEFLGDDQQHTGPTRFINSDVPLNFTLPDDPSIRRIDVLQPGWEEGRMRLRAIGSLTQ